MATIDHISWSEIEVLSRRLASKITEKFDTIVCLLRGGAIPGVIIANELGIESVLGVKVQQRGQELAVLDSASATEAMPYQGLAGNILVPLNDFDLGGKNVLVVDDVLDSGESARLIMEEIKKQAPALVKLATLHIKSYSRFKSDYYCEVKTNWLFYPWMSSSELSQMHARLASAEKNVNP
jgi:hypoxanthine phosphoribosyltransferase